LRADAFDILVTHTPPFGCANVQRDGSHEGSIAIADALLARAPRLHLCGHTHFSWGVEGVVGETFVKISAQQATGSIVDHRVHYESISCLDFQIQKFDPFREYIEHVPAFFRSMAGGISQMAPSRHHWKAIDRRRGRHP